MQYGPTTRPTRSVLAYDGEGKPRLYWDNGLPATVGVLPRIPKFLVDVETPEGFVASVILPAGPGRILVDDHGREVVTEHWGVLVGPIGQTLGVHLVTEQRSDGLVAWELIPSNGHADPKVARSWPGCLRFRKLRVRIATSGWRTTPVDLGPPGDWYFGIGNACAVRGVAFPAGDAALEAAAYRLASWADLVIPNPFPGLGPGEHVLPRALNHRAEPLYNNAPRLGPLWFDTNVENGYEGGGAGIHPVGGWECSENAARSFAPDVSRMLTRQAFARVHSRTGEPIGPEEWPKRGTYGLDDGRWSVDPWNWAGQLGSVVAMYGWNRGNAPANWAMPRELNPGPCASRQTVLRTQPQNQAHLGRVRTRVVPAWYFLRLWSARAAIRWSAFDVFTAWDVNGYLGQRLAGATANPGRGGEYQRELAHVCGTVADLLSISPPLPDEPSGRPSERNRALLWRAKYLAYRSRMSLGNGLARDGLGHAGGGSDNGVPWQEGLPAGCGAAAWFQLGLLACAEFDLWTAGGGKTLEVDDARFEWMFSEALVQGTTPAMLDNRQPGNYVGSSRNGVAANPLVDRTIGGSYGGAGYGHAIHDWAHLALWRRLRKDPRQLVIATSIGPSYPNLGALRANWAAQPNAWNALPRAYLQ